ncbi:MAG: hypothetical protein Kow009_12950 [Spirochaetales bacterium]
MDSLNRKILVVFLVLLVLDLLVRIWGSREDIGPANLEHLSLDPAAVSAVEISVAEERLVFERTPRGFELAGENAKTGPADGQGTNRKLLEPEASREVEAFLERICSMVREFIEEDIGDRTPTFGLDPGQAVMVRLHWKGGRETKAPFTVRFGTNLPLNVMYVYASFDDTPRLYKVLKTYRDSATALLHSFSSPGP